MTAGFLARLGWASACTLLLASTASLRVRADEPDTGLLSPRLAIVETDVALPLDDIVSGRARVGFNPVAGRGLYVVGKPGRATWLRLRMDLEASGGPRFVSMPRQAIDHLRLYQAGPPDRLIAETGIAQVLRRANWPDVFLLPLPAAAAGPTTLYLQIEGQGYLNLQPTIVSGEEMRAQAGASSAFFDILYGGFFAVGILAMLRRWMGKQHTLYVAAAAFACLVASVIGNYHLQLTVGGTSISSLPALPAAVWVLSCAPLLWATQQYAGHDKNLPEMAVALDRLGFVFLALGAIILIVPTAYLPQVQTASLGLLALTALLSGIPLFSDPRLWRWGPILIWLGFLPALLAIVLSMLQLMPASLLVRHGFQLLLAMQLLAYLVLPLIRQAVRKRASLKRSIVVEPSTEEKIAQAREAMMSGLQSRIETAAGGDMQWIAFRRLMSGLKPVLPQAASAVIAMNYHGEDILLVDPKSAEPRFQKLLAQRGSLLKNLSRSMAPQQIGLDFEGPEGPLQQVLLAIIPLPIERPGWGLLVIERSAKASYSDEELDVCTEFAALATTAGDEAAALMKMRQASELDVESGVYRREMFDQLLRKANEAAVQKRKPLSVLRVGIDDFPELDPDTAAAGVRTVVDLLREEIEYGDSISRFAPDEFMVLMSGHPIGEARTLGERVCVALRKREISTGEHGILSVSVGVAQMQSGERSPQPMLERVAKAWAKARQYGGDQVQAITTTAV
ncbi:MAG: diguanylate cyclase [Arenimonas sp.]